MNTKRLSDSRLPQKAKKAGFRGKKPIVENNGSNLPSKGDPGRGLRELLSTPIEEYVFTVRAANVLQNMGIRRVAQLAMSSEKEILKQKGCGKKTLQELRDLMEGLGLSIGMELDEITARRFRKQAEEEDKPRTRKSKEMIKRESWNRSLMRFISDLVGRERLQIIAETICSLEQMDDLVRRKAIPIRAVYDVVANKEPVTDAEIEKLKSDALTSIDSLSKTKDISPQTISALREFVESLVKIER